MTYNLHGSNGSISSDQVLERLDPCVPLHFAHICRVKELEASGMSYSGEDGDVLSSAYRASFRTEPHNCELGFVEHYAMRRAA